MVRQVPVQDVTLVVERRFDGLCSLVKGGPPLVGLGAMKPFRSIQNRDPWAPHRSKGPAGLITIGHVVVLPVPGRAVTVSASALPRRCRRFAA
jgi:hypothetical protein